MMKRATMALVCLLAGAHAGRATPIGLGLRVEHKQFLKFERTMVYLQMQSRLDAPLVFGHEEGNVILDLDVRRASGERMDPFREQPIVSAISVGGGETRTIRFDLSRWYDLSGTGRYLVKATARWKNRQFVSGSVAFDVVRGMELARVRQYLPGYDDVERIYSVRYVAREETEVAFLRVDEAPSGTNYGVFELGPIIRLFRPTIEIGKGGRVTVTHQSRPYCYTRTAFLSARTSVYRVDQSYHLPDGRPYPFPGSENASGSTNAMPTGPSLPKLPPLK